MKLEDVNKLRLGLYIIYWKDDEGKSLSAIGMSSDGTRWMAPTNWINPFCPGCMERSKIIELWDAVERVEEIAVRESE